MKIEYPKTSGEPLRVTILGRPNVGKSTLFNRLLGKKQSLVLNQPGVTRDRIFGETVWTTDGQRVPVLLTDTGGLEGDSFEKEIREQVLTAIESSQILLFVFDSKTGLMERDTRMVNRLRKAGILDRIPYIGVVNKVDLDTHEARIGDFFGLGFPRFLTVSAEHGRGIDDLKTQIFRLAAHIGIHSAVTGQEKRDSEGAEISKGSEDQNYSEVQDSKGSKGLKTQNKVPYVAIVGKPNVGKSTLINALLNQDRMITSPIPGTTVDSVDHPIFLNKKPYWLIDTAGIKRKSKTQLDLECLSVVMTKKAIERASVALLVLDGEKGIADQDEKIFGLLEESGCGVILVVNKWDTQDENKKFSRSIASKSIRKQMPFLDYAPIVFISALKKQGLDQIGKRVEKTMGARQTQVGTNELTKWVRAQAEIHNPKNAKFYLAHQSGRNPPTFIFRVSDPDKIHFSLRRHLSNQIRSRWGFEGNPIRLKFLQ